MNTHTVRAFFLGGDLAVSIDGIKDHQATRYGLEQMLPFTAMSANLSLREFFEFMLAIYTADRLIVREPRQWSRKIDVSFPVSDLQRWEPVIATIEQLLWQSMGDQFFLHPVRRTDDIGARPAGRTQSFALQHLEPTSVYLLSDGLDSLCGAFEACKTREGRVAFVSLLSNSRKYKPIYAAIQSLRSIYGASVVHHPIPMYLVDAPERQEQTQRSRTLLALAAGLTVAAGYGAPGIFVAENGMGILNLPAWPVQIKHGSSQVLHPANLPLWERISRQLIGGAIITYPNRFKTKAQMLRELDSRAHALIGNTSSCDRPQRRDEFYACGCCGSCDYRKKSLKYAGLSRFDGQYTRLPPKLVDYDPIDVANMQASAIAKALDSPDPWRSLVEIQDTLQSSITASNPVERAHLIASTLALLQMHVAELRNPQVLARAG